MVNGRIIHIVRDKGFGFIQSDEYPDNVFFHARGVKGLPFLDLRVGDAVQFEAPQEKTDKGYATSLVKFL